MKKKDNKKSDNSQEELNKLLSNIDNIDDVDIAELQKIFKNFNNPKINPFKRFFLWLLSFLMKIALYTIVNVSLMGFLNTFIEYTKWFYVLIYSAGLSVVAIIISDIVNHIPNFMFTLKYGLIIQVVSVLGIMLIFNYFVHDYLYFTDYCGLIIYYAFGKVLVNLLLYFIMRKVPFLG